MDWSSFLSGVFGAGIAGALLKMYLDHRLNIERERRKEVLLARQKQRDASAAVVDILSEWVRTTYTGEEFDGPAKWRLQTAYWRNILLLDKELLDILLPKLAGAPGAVTTNEIIVQARRVLLGQEAPDISAKDLNLWK